jgi:hypothetical protein
LTTQGRVINAMDSSTNQNIDGLITAINEKITVFSKSNFYIRWTNCNNNTRAD